MQLKQTGITITESHSKCFVGNWGNWQRSPNKQKLLMIPKTLCALKGIMDNESMEKQKVNGTKSLKGQNIAKLPWSLCANTLAQFTNVVHSSHCPFNRVKKWKNMFDCHNVNGKKIDSTTFIFVQYFFHISLKFVKCVFHICEI